MPPRSLDLRIEDAISTDIDYQEHERDSEPEQIDWLDESY